MHQHVACFHALWFRRLGKPAPKNGCCGGPAAQDVAKICTTLWRERFGSQNRQKLAAPGHFWKLQAAKFVPRCRARAIRKSKSLKPEGFGGLYEIQVCEILRAIRKPKPLKHQVLGPLFEAHHVMFHGSLAEKLHLVR